MIIYYIIVISIAIIILVIDYYIRHYQNKLNLDRKINLENTGTVINEKVNDYIFYGRLRYRLMTELELAFFQQLKRITDNYNLYIFPKVKISDLIYTKYKSQLGKINSKHIDFVICDKQSHPILFIELDDSTHNTKDAQERDRKKDIIFKSVNSEIFRVTPENADKKIYEIDKYLEKLYK